MRYRNHGRTEGEYLDDVTNPDHAVSEWYRTLRRTRGHRRAEQWLRLRWHRAGDRPAPTRPQLDPETVAAFLAWAAEHHHWKGRAGATDRTLLHAHAKVAVQVGTVEYAASSRRLAEVAHVQRQTATTATKRLAERKLLAILGRNVNATNLYRLHLRLVHTHTSSASPSGRLTTGSFVHHHDAFRWGALGPNAATVHAALDADEAGVSELAAATGVTRWTVRRVLDRLADHRLALEVEPGRWVRGYATLDDAAVGEGTFGRSVFERARHQAERELYTRSRGREAPRTADAARWSA